MGHIVTHGCGTIQVRRLWAKHAAMRDHGQGSRHRTSSRGCRGRSTSQTTFNAEWPVTGNARGVSRPKPGTGGSEMTATKRPFAAPRQLAYLVVSAGCSAPIHSSVRGPSAIYPLLLLTVVGWLFCVLVAIGVSERRGGN